MALDTFGEYAGNLIDELNRHKGVVDAWVLRMIDLILRIKKQLHNWLDQQSGTLTNELSVKSQLYENILKTLEALADPDPQDEAAVAHYAKTLERIKDLMNQHTGFSPNFVYKDFIDNLENELNKRLDIKNFLKEEEDARKRQQDEIERLLE